ncbi:putative AMP-binding enzyme C-terminal domain [Lyophyllum shimeji]|uniref:AMP-binding enzyme C-terminal domain n=1 Tax=Lyophyllum shimeji TaxID=47721 RepID=A0A9P3UQ45_LYOSH|nr:putative AMP-binding enzyme C-terminal domain [Lyophyllum shimeji]
MSWSPVRTLEETDDILCAPGHLHEVEDIFLNGRVQKVYKHLWPSVRSFWISSIEKYADKTYIVFAEQRSTYGQVHKRVVKVAAVFRHVYNIQKGDRVGICSRNCPDYLVSFWAAQLLGAIPVLMNAWLPVEPLGHCLQRTECTVVMLDAERADLLAPAVAGGRHSTNFLVFDPCVDKDQWPGMDSFPAVVDNYQGDVTDILGMDPGIMPEDDALIIFTSGTTGMPKGVLSTQRQFLTNVPNVMIGGIRASLRKGGEYPDFKDENSQKGILIAVPLFHVTGLTSFMMLATATGLKIVLTPKWDVEEAARLIKLENVRVAGGVPSMVSDLLESSLAGYPLDGILFGGSPAPITLVPKAQEVFPTAYMMQAYGMTETNSVAVSFAGEDYAARPTSTGRATPVNEIKIVQKGRSIPPGVPGEVWLRGPNIMQCYWRDSKATEAALTNDGWLRTGDLGFLDDEGFLYIKDRIKDIIIRGGENIDSVSVENALYRDPRVLEAAAVGVPDARLGELVAAVVSIKPAFRGNVTEAALIAGARKYLPRFAVPMIIIVRDEPLEHTPSGKIVKGQLRELARRHWEARNRDGVNIVDLDNPVPDRTTSQNWLGDKPSRFPGESQACHPDQQGKRYLIPIFWLGPSFCDCSRGLRYLESALLPIFKIYDWLNNSAVRYHITHQVSLSA